MQSGAENPWKYLNTGYGVIDEHYRKDIQKELFKEITKELFQIRFDFLLALLLSRIRHADGAG